MNILITIKMFSKSRCLPKILQYSNKTCTIQKSDCFVPIISHIPLACIYTLHKFSNRPESKVNKIYNSKKCVQNVLTYCTNVKHIPPPPKKSDVFGSLGGLKYEAVELDDKELKEEERLKHIKAHVPRKLKPSLGQYAEMIKNYCQKGDLKRAEAVMQMCKRNNDKPSPYMFTLLIRAFAVHGDVSRCFKYFGEMKTRQYKIGENVFTSLFNACGNSPDPDRAINYLNRAREYMEKINCSMNHAHYNSIVKALGRHHKYSEAHKLFQTMLDNRIKIGISTINSLMYAANSNKESGLKDILQIWQFMRKLKIPPDVFSYHLLLRGIRETNFGGCTMKELLLAEKDSEVITDTNRPDLLVYPPIVSQLPFENIHKKSQALIDSSESAYSNSELTETTTVTNSNKLMKKNTELLPASIADMDLDAILKENKLILFGGVNGFITKMEEDKIEPSVKTLTYLMDLVPSSTAAENEIIKLAKTKKIPLDIDFFNMLIKKRALRKSKKDAKAVLVEIQKADLKPNIVTYGVLALTCDSGNESRELLQTLKSTGQPLNKYIADSLLNAAFLRRDFMFILELMERMLFQKVRLDEETYEKLDKFQQNMRDLSKRKDKRAKTEFFKAAFAKFNMRYKKWQEEMGRKPITENVSKEN